MKHPSNKPFLDLDNWRYESTVHSSSGQIKLVHGLDPQNIFILKLIFLVWSPDILRHQPQSFPSEPKSSPRRHRLLHLLPKELLPQKPLILGGSCIKFRISHYKVIKNKAHLWDLVSAGVGGGLLRGLLLVLLLLGCLVLVGR